MDKARSRCGLIQACRAAMPFVRSFPLLVLVLVVVRTTPWSRSNSAPPAAATTPLMSKSRCRAVRGRTNSARDKTVVYIHHEPIIDPTRDHAVRTPGVRNRQWGTKSVEVVCLWSTHTHTVQESRARRWTDSTAAITLALCPISSETDVPKAATVVVSPHTATRNMSRSCVLRHAFSAVLQDRV